MNKDEITTTQNETEIQAETIIRLAETNATHMTKKYKKVDGNFVCYSTRFE